MKRILWIVLALAAVIALLCCGAALAADQETAYPLSVAGVDVTDANRADILGNGVFSFDGDKTLTVTGSYASSRELIMNNGINGLTVRFTGNCTLSGDSLLYCEADTMLTGGSVSFTSGSEGIYVSGSNMLTIINMSLNMNTDYEGIIGTYSASSRLVINGASVSVTCGTQGDAMGGFKGGITLTNCAITSPPGAVISNGVVLNNGNSANAVTITSSIPLTGHCGDNLTWSLNESTGIMSILGHGPMTDFTTANPSPFKENTKIRTIVMDEGVTSVGNNAFSGCTGLTGVVFPSTLQSIGAWAFYRCSITELTLPSGLTSISGAAFNACANLQSIVIPSGMTAINDSTFMQCANLVNVTIPESITVIGNNAFSNCVKLTNLKIPDSVTSIGAKAFFNCKAITGISIPADVTNIGSEAFRACSNLADIYIYNPDCIIGDSNYNVFTDCASGFTLYGWPGSTAETYADEAGIVFESLGCLTGSCGDNLTYSFDPVTGALTISGTGAMTNYTDAGDVPWYSYRKSITSAVLENGVTRIGNSAFVLCTGLTSVTIPDSVTSIDNHAFYYCTGLTSVTIPDSVISIGTSAFLGCTGLTSVTIPESVSSIGELAFKGCTGLANVTILNPDCTIGDSYYDVFLNCDSIFRLCGYSGSTAEAYAANTVNPCAFESLGDLPIQTGSCGDNVTWTLDRNTGLLTISGTGATYDYDWENSVLSPFDANETITSVTFSAGITRIGSWLLEDCANLTSVSIPATVESIGLGAFYGCGLTELTIPEGVAVLEQWAFNHNEHLNTMLLPDTLTTIGVAPFANCSSLTSVTIPDGVTSIGVSAFAKCTKLTSVTILNPDCVIGDSNFDVFNDCSSGMVLRGLTNSTADLYAQAAGITFESLGTHTGIVTGSCGEHLTYSLDVATRALNITGTGEMANYSSTAAHVPWYGYHSVITSVSISNGVTSIGYWAFADCTSLTSVTIPDSVTSIGYCAFRDCTSLISATILNPDCVIGDSDYDVFKGCDGAFTLFGYSGSTAEAYAANTVNPCAFEALMIPEPTFFLPSGLQTLEEQALWGIAAEAVVFPKSLQNITGNVHQGSQIRYIYGFPGTVAEEYANFYEELTFIPIDDAWLASH